MKKRILFAVVAVILVVALAACTGNTGKDENKVQIESSVALLNSVWDTYAEEEKFFVMGGDFSNPVDNAAGAFNLTDVENATATLHIAEDALALVDEAGTMIHGMNANTFSAGAFSFADAETTTAMVDVIKEAISGTHWMCGFPETLVIQNIADTYVLVAFGVNDAMNPFFTKLATAFPGATTLVDEAIA